MNVQSDDLWYTKQICQVMSGVYSLSTTVEITFILPKLYLKKINKKATELCKLHLLLYMNNWATFHHFFFHLSYPKVLYESVLLSSKNVALCKLSIIYYYLSPLIIDLSFPKAYSKCVLLCSVSVKHVK